MAQPFQLVPLSGGPLQNEMVMNTRNSSRPPPPMPTIEQVQVPPEVAKNVATMMQSFRPHQFRSQFTNFLAQITSKPRIPVIVIQLMTIHPQMTKDMVKQVLQAYNLEYPPSSPLSITDPKTATINIVAGSCDDGLITAMDSPNINTIIVSALSISQKLMNAIKLGITTGVAHLDPAAVPIPCPKLLIFIGSQNEPGSYVTPGRNCSVATLATVTMMVPKIMPDDLAPISQSVPIANVPNAINALATFQRQALGPQPGAGGMQGPPGGPLPMGMQGPPGGSLPMGMQGPPIMKNGMFPPSGEPPPMNMPMGGGGGMMI